MLHRGGYPDRRALHLAMAQVRMPASPPIRLGTLRSTRSDTNPNPAFNHQDVVRCACLPCSTYCSSTPARAKRLAPFSSARLTPSPDGPLTHFASPLSAALAHLLRHDQLTAFFHHRLRVVARSNLQSGSPGR